MKSLRGGVNVTDPLRQAPSPPDSQSSNYAPHVPQPEYPAPTREDYISPPLTRQPSTSRPTPEQLKSDQIQKDSLAWDLLKLILTKAREQPPRALLNGLASDQVEGTEQYIELVLNDILQPIISQIKKKGGRIDIGFEITEYCLTPLHNVLAQRALNIEDFDCLGIQKGSLAGDLLNLIFLLWSVDKNKVTTHLLEKLDDKKTPVYDGWATESYRQILLNTILQLIISRFRIEAITACANMMANA